MSVRTWRFKSSRAHQILQNCSLICIILQRQGRLAQLARAPRLHRGGRGFEPLSAHHSPSPFGHEGFLLIRASKHDYLSTNSLIFQILSALFPASTLLNILANLVAFAVVENSRLLYLSAISKVLCLKLVYFS